MLYNIGNVLFFIDEAFIISSDTTSKPADVALVTAPHRSGPTTSQSRPRIESQRHVPGIRPDLPYNPASPPDADDRPLDQHAPDPALPVALLLSPWPSTGNEHLPPAIQDGLPFWHERSYRNQLISSGAFHPESETCPGRSSSRTSRHVGPSFFFRPEYGRAQGPTSLPDVIRLNSYVINPAISPSCAGPSSSAFLFSLGNSRITSHGQRLLLPLLNWRQIIYIFFDKLCSNTSFRKGQHLDQFIMCTGSNTDLLPHF